MRKIIETTSTLALWAVFLIGSGLAISDFFFNDNVSELIVSHLTLIAWAPFLAVLIFGAMLIAVRFEKNDTTKKSLSSEHTILWSSEEIMNAQTGKVVDLHFAGAGLSCQVVSRDKVATLLHSENQTKHITVAAAPVDESSWNLQKVVARSVIILIALLPRSFFQ